MGTRAPSFLDIEKRTALLQTVRSSAQLLRFFCGIRFCLALLAFVKLRVSRSKPFDAARSVHKLLLARVERMAVRAYLDTHLFLGGSRLYGVAAGANHRDVMVLWVYFFLQT